MAAVAVVIDKVVGTMVVEFCQVGGYASFVPS